MRKTATAKAAPAPPAPPKSSVEIFDCEQGTAEWHQLRCGIPTASEFSAIMANGRDGGASKMRKNYMHRLAVEVLTGEPVTGYSSQHMERGHEMEPAAREEYEFTRGVKVRQVGFIRNGNRGCSPDGLIVGTRAALEIKTQEPLLLIETMQRDTPPPEHRAQCQGILMVAELESLDLKIFWPKMPECVFRIERDDDYIRELGDQVDLFNYELKKLVAQLRDTGGAKRAAR